MGDSEKEVLDSTSTEEVSIDDVSVEELAVKTASKAKDKKKSKSEKKGFFKSLIAEFKKIIWPSRQSLGRQTLAVVVCTVLLGVVITVVDILIRFGLDIILK